MGFTGNLRKSMAEMLFPYNFGGGLFSAGRWLFLVDRSKDVMMFLDVCNLWGFISCICTYIIIFIVFSETSHGNRSTGTLFQ